MLFGIPGLIWNEKAHITCRSCRYHYENYHHRIAGSHFSELDVVKLLRDDIEAHVPAGSIGTIVSVHNNCEAFTIEFFDKENETIEASLNKVYYSHEIEHC